MNLRRYVAETTVLCTVAPSICGWSVLNMLLVTILAPSRLRWLLDFYKISAHLPHFFQKTHYQSLYRARSILSKSSLSFSKIQFNIFNTFTPQVCQAFYSSYVSLSEGNRPLGRIERGKNSIIQGYS